MKTIENILEDTAGVKHPAIGIQPQPLVWDVHGAARRLSISPVTIRKLIRQRRLSRIPGVRKILIPDVSLREFAATAE